MFEQHLGGAEDVAGGMERDGDAVNLPLLTERQRVPTAGGILAIAGLHDRDGVGCGEDCAMAGARVIGVAMRDDGPALRHGGIDERIDRRDAEVSLEEGQGHG